MRQTRTLTVLFLMMGLAGVAQSEMPGLVAIHSVDSSSLDFELHAATVSSNNSTVYVVVTGNERNQPDGSQVLSIAAVDPNGAVRMGTLEDDVQRTASPGVAVFEHRLVQGVVPRAGRVLSVIGGSSLITVNAADLKVLRKDRLPIDAQAFFSSAKQRLLVVGSTGADVTVTEINDDGSVISKHAIPRPRIFIADAAPTSDDGLIIVGLNVISPSEVSLWIAKMTATGRLQSEAVIEGRSGNIAQLHDGTFVVIYESLRGGAAEFRAAGLSADLKEKWNVTVMSASHAVQPPAIAALGKGGFVVSAAKDRGLFVSRFDSTGKLMWTHTRDGRRHRELVANVMLLRAASMVLVPYTAFAITDVTALGVVQIARLSMD